MYFVITKIIQTKPKKVSIKVLMLFLSKATIFDTVWVESMMHFFYKMKKSIYIFIILKYLQMKL